jgi:hypothetical protein
VIPESGWKATSAILDGACMPTKDGYEAETATKKLLVPYHMASDAAEALVVCMAQGLIVEKLRRMTPEKAAVVYITTIARPDPQN